MPRRIGGVSKMIDNQVTVDRVISVDESLCALLPAKAPIALSAAVTFLFRRFSWRCVEPALFVRTSSLAGPISMLTLSAKSFLVS
jgi:hypothetical protein